MRMFFALALMLVGLTIPSLAQTESAPWQDSVTGQIEAFRAGDADGALSFAGQGFRAQFDGRPEVFLAAIAASGYAVIVESRSHSFGEFKMVGDALVLQVVKFVGSNQSLYEAVYQLGNEPDEGWRVLGVILRKQAGIAI